MKFKKYSTFLFLGTIMLFLLIIACSVGVLNNSKEKDTQLQVLIHDEPFVLSDKTVEALNITVERMEIIRSSDGEHITLMDIPKTMDILQIDANNPVVLSTVGVQPGTYEQLRLILSAENTIVVDGEEFPIIIASGEQTGVKLDGPFNIPKGKLFKLILDFVARESVIYNKGQGYKLKPVIEISDVQDVIGIFRGNIEMGLGSSESIIKLYDNKTFKAKISKYRKYEITGDYYYNSYTKILKLDDLKVKRSGMPEWQLKKIAKRLPDKIEFDVVQWTPDSVLIFDVAGSPRTLTRTDSFSFSSSYGATDLYLTINYPDSSKNGKMVIVELKPVDDGSPVIYDYNQISGDSCIVDFSIPNNYFLTNSIKYYVSVYLFDNAEDFNVEFGYSANELGFVMSDAYFSETTNNPWQPIKTIIVNKDQNNIEEISFPKRLNIKMIPDDFSTNNPVISWDVFPGADNGYLVIVLLKDQQEEKDIKYDNDQNKIWDVVFSKVVKDGAEVQVFSNKFLFNPVYPAGDAEFNQIITQPGELIRIEVYVLDGSGRLNTITKSGALYMDSVNIKR